MGQNENQIYPEWQAAIRAVQTPVLEKRQQEIEAEKACREAEEIQAGKDLERCLKILGVQLDKTPVEDSVILGGSFGIRLTGCHRNRENGDVEYYRIAIFWNAEEKYNNDPAFYANGRNYSRELRVNCLTEGTIQDSQVDLADILDVIQKNVERDRDRYAEFLQKQKETVVIPTTKEMLIEALRVFIQENM